jgi:hypothetical protein
MCSFLLAGDVESLVRASGLNLSSHQAIEIFEVLLIQAYQPDFQRHHENRTVAYIKKQGYPQAEDLIAILKNSG